MGGLRRGIALSATLIVVIERRVLKRPATGDFHKLNVDLDALAGLGRGPERSAGSCPSPRGPRARVGARIGCAKRRPRRRPLFCNFRSSGEGPPGSRLTWS